VATANAPATDPPADAVGIAPRRRNSVLIVQGHICKEMSE